MTTVDNISDLKSRKAQDGEVISVLGYYTPGDGGGGEFYWDNASTEDDNLGTVLQVSGTGRWKRIFTGRTVNVKWFGAKGDNNAADAATNQLAFEAAKEALPLVDFPPYLQGGGSIIIPGGTYHLTNTWVIDRGLNIIGSAGSGFLNETILKFPADTTGIKVTAPFVPVPSVKAGIGTVIQNIEVFCYQASTNVNAHGFDIKGCVTLIRCTASYFEGNGFELFTDAGDLNSPNFGNAAFSRLERCRAQFCANGFHDKGGDSNVILYDTCDATVNRRWGFFIESFLGNTFINCHVADNTYSPDNLSQVTHMGGHYICVADNGPATTVYEPGVTSGWEDYWVDVGSPFDTYFTVWNNSTDYLSGGGYNSYPGLNANNTFIGCYSEGGQPSQFGLRTMVMGGDLGAVIFPINREPMIFEAIGSKYSFRSPVQFARAGLNHKIVLGTEGLGVYPDEGISSNGLNLIYNDTTKRFEERYANASFISRFVTSNDGTPADYGLAAVPLGKTVFPNGFYLSRNESTGFRKVSMATAAPTNGDYAVGDIVLKAITTGGDTVLGWRCIVAGSPGTFETLNITVS